jgi:hypothetical protein
MIQFKDSNVWTVIALAVTSLLGPIVVWSVSSGRIESVKLQLERSKLELEQGKQLAEFQEKLIKALEEQARIGKAIVDRVTELKDIRSAMGDARRMQLADQLALNSQQIVGLKKEIARLSGSPVGDIPGGYVLPYPELGPSGRKP